MDQFIKELEIGEIHQRDRWQFELKSEFSSESGLQESIVRQEFYLFIPNSLQVNAYTYPKSQFYQDQTNLIRYKTPEFTLNELIDESNVDSPLNRLSKLFSPSSPNSEDFSLVEDELKLLANIVRSSIREHIRQLISIIEKKPLQKEQILVQTRHFCAVLTTLRSRYLNVQKKFVKRSQSTNQNTCFYYIDEFQNRAISYYLTGLLDYLRRNDEGLFYDVGQIVNPVLMDEKDHRKEFLKEPKICQSDSSSNEYVLYRNSLLNKFVMDVLLLNTARSSVNSRFQNLIGSLAAGIAMLFFFILFVHQGTILINNSMPFIVLTVILYILKDRIKEGLKTVSYRQFAKWFSDFKTEITSPTHKRPVGKMEEYFSYVLESELSEEITRTRNREFHDVLDAIKRPEQVLYYKKKMTLYRNGELLHSRRQSLNIIFRFNISQFLRKADNPTHEYVSIDPSTLEFSKIRLPKVYHINIILRNTYYKKREKKEIELKKFRLIIDKNGIKRVEHIH